MAAEQFANYIETTLTGSAGSGDATITVASATGFPTSAQYRIRVDSEVMIVTAGAGTTTWTVTRGAEGTTAAAHGANTIVGHVLTAGALLAAINTSQVDPITLTGSGDQQPTIQAAIDALSATGGIVQLPIGTWKINKPLVMQRFVRLLGINARGPVTCLQLNTATWPHTTVTTGITTPASSATTFSLVLNAIPTGMVLPSGTGVVYVVAAGEFIPIIFTGTTGTTLTGCQTNYTSMVISTGATVGVPAVIDSDPAASVTTFGTTIEHIAVDCQNIAGSGAYYSNHAQEDAGPIRCFTFGVGAIGLCYDNALAGSTAQNCRMYGCTVRLGATASDPTAAVAVSVFLNSTNLRQIGDFTLNTDTLADRGGIGIRVDGCSGLDLVDIHVEHVASPFLLGSHKVCGAVHMQNIDMGAGTAAGIQRVNTQTFTASALHSVDTHTIQDTVRSHTVDDVNVGFYVDLGTKGVLTDSASVTFP